MRWKASQIRDFQKVTKWSQLAARDVASGEDEASNSFPMREMPPHRGMRRLALTQVGLRRR